MIKRELAVIEGMKNKMQVAGAALTDATPVKIQRAQAQPGSGNS